MEHFISAWHWPQWTVFTLYILNIMITSAVHGKTTERTYNAFYALGNSIIGFLILAAGGFWG